MTGDGTYSINALAVADYNPPINTMEDLDSFKWTPSKVKNAYTLCYWKICMSRVVW